MNKEEFIKELKKLNIELNSDTLAKLDEYYNILNEENKKYNLTRIITKEEVYLKHFYDSLTITKIITKTLGKITTRIVIKAIIPILTKIIATISRIKSLRQQNRRITALMITDRIMVAYL